MIKSVIVYDRRRIEGMLKGTWDFPYPNNKWGVISIYTRPNNAFFTLDAIDAFKSMGMIDYLSLQFWDVDGKDRQAILAQYPHAVFFDKTHAIKIIDFVQSLNSKDEDVGLIVHCDAGISRSGAVGSFVVDYLGLNQKEFLVANPNILPNAFILSVLRRTAGLIPSFASVGGENNKEIK